MWSRTHRRANCLLYPLPLRRGAHSLMARVATCFYIREDHVLPQFCKNPLHCLSRTHYRFNRFRPPHPAFLLYFLTLHSFQVTYSGISIDFIHSLQPALSQPRLTCLTLRLPHNLSLPLYIAPSFSFPPILSIQPHTHTSV